MFTRAELQEAGFVGWLALQASDVWENCPTSGGVYVVAHPSRASAQFANVSCGGWFKGRDPSVALEALQANWVDGAEVVYIGKANNLRRRIREFARFGAGKAVAHWGGRLIWQLTMPERLQIAWKETHGEDPLSVEAALIRAFREAHGKPPFANDPRMLGR